MKIAFVYKKDKIKDKSIIPKLIESFEKKGHTVTILYSGSELKDVDYAIVLGGDGALLHTAIVAAKQGIQVMGINYGTVGFLTELEASETLKAADIICGKHEVLPRTMLKVTIDGKEYYALNECTLQRDYSKPYGNQVADIGVVLNGNLIREYTLDGIAIATPTGSTAYSLSAGGSILTPDVKAFIITPICPMSLFARPTIISDEGKITFDLSKQKDPLKLYTDGKPIGTVIPGSTKITIEKAPYTANFITRDTNRLFAVINKKLLR